MVVVVVVVSRSTRGRADRASRRNDEDDERETGAFSSPWTKVRESENVGAGTNGGDV